MSPYPMLARYNAEANARLYGACAQLSEATLLQDRGAFFKSILGTLNHILVGDTLWMARFEGGTAPAIPLDAHLHSELAALWDARQTMDARISAFVDGLTQEALSGHIEYVNNQGLLFRDPVDMLLLHFFNHQTHHRGQVHAMLTAAGGPAPVLDMHRVIKPDP